MLEEIMAKIDAIKAMSVVLILIGIIVIAIVERIKAETTLKSFWYTIISIGVGCGIFAIFVYAPVIVIAFLFVGLLASGTFDLTKYAGGNNSLPK
jgi:Fe2+ transport system protein B